MLLLAAVVRLGVVVAYWPALLWTDSFAFLGAGHAPPWMSVDKPSGYPFLVWALRTPAVIVAVQHLAGMISGGLLYWLLRRRGLRPLPAAAAAAIVLLDSYAIALEQHVLSEAFFTLLLLCWAFLATERDPSRSCSAGAGFALASAAVLRPVALLVIPIWFVAMLWGNAGTSTRRFAVAALACPLLAYASLHAGLGRGFALTEREGHALYARVAQLADCRAVSVPQKEEKLCPMPADRIRRDPVDYFSWSPSSPALTTYGDPYSLTVKERAQADRALRTFALRVIAARPVEFLKLIGRETLRFFRPGAMSGSGYDEPISFPQHAREVPEIYETARRLYAPGYVPRVRAPARALVEYQRWFHTPRWLLAVFVLAATVALSIAAVGRVAMPRRRETFLLVGSGCALLIGGALNHFEVRYLLPAVPLLVAGGCLALADLWRARAL